MNRLAGPGIYWHNQSFTHWRVTDLHAYPFYTYSKAVEGDDGYMVNYGHEDVVFLKQMSQVNPPVLVTSERGFRDE